LVQVGFKLQLNGAVVFAERKRMGNLVVVLEAFLGKFLTPQKYIAITNPCEDVIDGYGKQGEKSYFVSLWMRFQSHTSISSLSGTLPKNSLITKASFFQTGSQV